MTTKEHISAIISRTFEVIQEVYDYQKETREGKEIMQKHPSKTGGCRILFPLKFYKEKDENRISEQELRFIFVEQLNKEIREQNWDVYYSIETPTKGDKYCFPQKGEPYYNEHKKEDGKGDSANFDLVIHDNMSRRIALIEFKSNNSGNHAKDILKLKQEEEIKENPLRYFIEVIKNANNGTYESLRKKMEKKGQGTIFRCYSLVKREEISKEILPDEKID